MAAACEFPGLLGRDGTIAQASHRLDKGHLQCVYLMLKAKHSMTAAQHMKVSQALLALQSQLAASLPQVTKVTEAACCILCLQTACLTDLCICRWNAASCIPVSLPVIIRSTQGQ